MIRLVPILLLVALCLPACKRDDMADQPRYKPLARSTLFLDGTSARPIPPGTLVFASPGTAPSSRPHSPADYPFPITPADLHRGQELFNVYCSPCHSRLGDGNGMIVQRGLTHPPSYHIDRLRAAPPSYFVDVITNGIGAMYSYNDRVAPNDRWRIAAYIRALQLSQHAPADTLSGEDRNHLKAQP